MKKTVLRAVSLLLVCALTCLALGGCSGKDEKESQTQPGTTAAPIVEATGLKVIHEPEFGGVYIQMTIEDFNALGFAYGDSVKVAFSNGYTMDDLPYYNGYYTLTGSPLLIAYPGYDYIKAAINNGADLWDVAGLSETDTAAVTLSARGKYADIQNARDIHYTDERSDYESDEVFANFRCISVGNLKEGVVYRSASPCDDQHNRATFVNELIKNAGVRCILDLADTDEKIRGYISAEGFACDYFLSLYQSGSVIPLAMNMNFGSEEFKSKVANGLAEMAQKEGPYLIHCTEGKDRTGFVCMLLEAFAGASYAEIVEDYMVTYANYYGITPEKDAARYNVIVENVLEPMIGAMVNDATADIKTADLSVCAENYLRAAGLTDAQLTALRAKLVQ